MSRRNGWRDVVRSRQLPRERGTHARSSLGQAPTSAGLLRPPYGVRIADHGGQVPAPACSVSPPLTTRPGPPGASRRSRLAVRKLPANCPALQAATQVIHQLVIVAPGSRKRVRTHHLGEVPRSRTGGRGRAMIGSGAATTQNRHQTVTRVTDAHGPQSIGHYQDDPRNASRIKIDHRNGRSTLENSSHDGVMGATWTTKAR
jgi:hypothetical protein